MISSLHMIVTQGHRLYRVIKKQLLLLFLKNVKKKTVFRELDYAGETFIILACRYITSTFINVI